MIMRLAASMALCLVLCAPAGGASYLGEATPAKTPILDGSVVHDAGQMLLNITNFGLIGSWPGASTSFSHAPSATWPATNGHDLLWGAGLWVGARVGGTPHVSTGQYEIEFYPTDDPLDVIYTMARGETGGARYPDPLFDDDGDGLEDEDPKNARDDDGDGLVDEDYGVIGDQHFRCVNSDLNPAPGPVDHVPLGLEVVQQSFQWTDSSYDDFVGFEFTIRNVGVDLLEDVVLGFFADFDIPAGEGSPSELPWFFADDAPSPTGASVPVALAGAYGVGDVTSAIGVVLLDHSTDASATTAPSTVAIRSFQTFTANAPFDRGGDPTNDAERYEALASEEHDPVPALHDEGQADDWRILISSGPFPSLAPGEELTYTLALVAGANVQDLVANAAAAVEVYRGGAFDRDLDPTTGPDGRETIVHWLLPQEVPVAAAWGTLRAHVEGGQAIVDLEANSVDGSRLSVRRVDAGGRTRTWAGLDLVWRAISESKIAARLVDDEAIAWPATYQLLDAGALVTLASIVADGTVPTLDLRTSPNPGHDRTTIAYALPRAGQARLDVYDARGRRVRTLVAGSLAAGSGSIVWNGRDDRGRAVASGTYHVRLIAEGRVAQRTLVWVR